MVHSPRGVAGGGASGAKGNQFSHRGQGLEERWGEAEGGGSLAGDQEHVPGRRSSPKEENPKTSWGVQREPRRRQGRSVREGRVRLGTGEPRSGTEAREPFREVASVLVPQFQADASWGAKTARRRSPSGPAATRWDTPGGIRVPAPGS